MKRILSIALLSLLAAGSLATGSAWADKHDDVMKKRNQINAQIAQGIYVPSANGRAAQVWTGNRYVPYYGTLPVDVNQIAANYGNRNYRQPNIANARRTNVPNGKAWGWHRKNDCDRQDYRSSNRYDHRKYDRRYTADNRTWRR